MATSPLNLGASAGFHLLAYYTASLASGASLVPLGVVPDQVITSDGVSGYFMPDNYSLWAAYAGNDAYNDVEVDQPSLREPFLPHLQPFSLTQLPANIPPVYKEWEDGFDLHVNEYLRIRASRDVVVASAALALIWIGKNRTPIPPGEKFTCRWTAAASITAGTWTLGSITLLDTLPDGKYAIVGMDAFGANLVAARVAFVGGGFRPGVLAQQAQGEWTQPSFDRNEFGCFGYFLNTVIPQVEFFGFGAGSAQIGYFDLVKVA